LGTKGIFITVRTGSTRLPNKPILKIKEKYTIEYVIDSVKSSKYADLVVLCTTTRKEDLVLCDIARNNNIEYFQGSEHNKWERWRHACEKFDIDFFVNADGDDLFYDAGLADICFKQHLNNPKKRVVIDGQGLYNDVYGFDRAAINKICSLEGSDQTEPHHLIEFLRYTDIKVDKILNIPDLYKKNNLRMTLDYPEDLQFFKTIIESFKDSGFTLEDVINYTNLNPQVREINYFREEAWKENQKAAK